ncbi:hypothetical protein QQ056_06630 [Oscillatoria laete-virens NRMC-F 0139]|nr:hypothetical protein [Oscillatoria laete-virens]MDL5053218.1 hypothetical protein [Oscillatoria laete-virens NRMC-F 0139]
MSFPRPLTDQERALARWMIQHGADGAERFLEQLDQATVVSGCDCGCASVDFQIGDRPRDYRPGLTIISDYLYERSEEEKYGVFIFTQDDMLSGIETHSFCDRPAPLPRVDELIPFEGGYKKRVPQRKRSSQSDEINSGKCHDPFVKQGLRHLPP